MSPNTDAVVRGFADRDYRSNKGDGGGRAGNATFDNRNHGKSGDDGVDQGSQISGDGGVAVSEGLKETPGLADWDGPTKRADLVEGVGGVGGEGSGVGWSGVNDTLAIFDGRPAPTWRPLINAYASHQQFVIFAELAGVPISSVEVRADRDTVTIRGERPLPEPDCDRAALARLLALEIDHGGFERVVHLPQSIDPARVDISWRDGLLRVDVPLAPSAA